MGIHNYNMSLQIWKSFLIVFATVLLAYPPATLLSNNNGYHQKPKTVLQEVSKRGANIVVTELYNDSSKWNYVLQHIKLGSVDWLNVAVALYPGSDAGASEMLVNSVGEALENAPINVFKIAFPKYRLEDICSSPDVDDKRYNSFERSMNAIDRRIKKISTITDRNYKEVCAQSIQLLEEAKIGIKKYYGQ